MWYFVTRNSRMALVFSAFLVFYCNLFLWNAELKSEVSQEVILALSQPQVRMIYASVIPDGHVLPAVDDSWWWRFHSFHWQHSPRLHYINCYKFLLVANSNIPFSNTGPLLLSLSTLYIWNGSRKFCVGVWIEVSIPTRIGWEDCITGLVSYFCQ